MCINTCIYKDKTLHFITYNPNHFRAHPESCRAYKNVVTHIWTDWSSVKKFIAASSDCGKSLSRSVPNTQVPFIHGSNRKIDTSSSNLGRDARNQMPLSCVCSFDYTHHAFTRNIAFLINIKIHNIHLKDCQYKYIQQYLWTGNTTHSSFSISHGINHTKCNRIKMDRLFLCNKLTAGLLLF